MLAFLAMTWLLFGYLKPEVARLSDVRATPFGAPFGRQGVAMMAPCVRQSPRWGPIHRPGHNRPASTSVAIHGMTSSSIVSSDVVASKPRIARDLRTSGIRSWTSCSKGASLT